MAKARVSWLVVVIIGVLMPVTSHAGDVFSGFQMDNRSQYFSYVGARVPLVQTTGGTRVFIQGMGAGLGYGLKSNGQVVDANVQFFVPSLGVSQTLGTWTVSVLAGPQLRRIEEERVNARSSTNHQIGAYVQAEAYYWHEKGNVHAIASYADLDTFFWGRLRGKVRAYHPEQGCCPVYVGWDGAAMGNGGYKAVQTGPVLEVLVGKFSLLARGGYQNSSSFHSGAYGGFEVYVPF